MFASINRTLAAAVAIVFGSLGASVQGQLVDFTSVEGVLSGDAYAYDWKTGKEDSDEFSGKAGAFDDLPISGDASAFSKFGSATSYGSLSGNATASSLNLGASAGGDAFADTTSGSASSSASAELSCRFTVDEPRWVEFDFFCSGWFGGSAFAEMYVDGKFYRGTEAYGEEMAKFEYLLLPGVDYELVMSAYGGGSDFDFDTVSGDAYISVNDICGYRGALQQGDNDFDTFGADQTMDLEGLCDPGDFGDDVIHNVAYYSFTPDVDTTYTFSTCGLTDLDTRLAVLAQGCDAGSVIACTDEARGCPGYTSILEVPLEAGTVYTLAIGATFLGDVGEGIIRVSKPDPVMYPVSIAGNATSSGFTESQCGEVNLDDSDVDSQGFADFDELPVTTVIGYFGNGGRVDATADVSSSPGYNGFTFEAVTTAYANTQTGAGCEWVSARGYVDADLEFVLQRSSTLRIEYRVDSNDWEGERSSFVLLDPQGDPLITVEDEPFDGPTEGSVELLLLPGRYTIVVQASADHTDYASPDTEESGVALEVKAFGVGIEGDFNGDGLVNGADLGLLVGAWGTAGPGDFNGDGTVDSADLGLLLALWSP